MGQLNDEIAKKTGIISLRCNIHFIKSKTFEYLHAYEDSDFWSRAVKGMD
jgi:hypothetical protein